MTGLTVRAFAEKAKIAFSTMVRLESAADEIPAGNVETLKKLKKAEYITVKKGFKGKYPVTTCKITNKGVKAFEEYVNCIKQYCGIDSFFNNKNTIIAINYS